MLDKDLSLFDSQIDEVVSFLKEGKFKFIDAGCGIGGSIEYCQKVFDKIPGIGFDKDLEKINIAKNKKLKVCFQTVTEVQFPHNCVSFSSMMDFLEHLPNIELAEQVLFMLGYASRDFLFIRHPSFESIEYLRKLNLKITWTNWSGHKNMMKISDFIYVFDKFGWNDYRIIPRKMIENSMHSAILPINYPSDSTKFEESLGLNKPIVAFDQPIFEQYDIFVKLNPDMPQNEWDKITTATTNS